MQELSGSHGADGVIQNSAKDWTSHRGPGGRRGDQELHAVQGGVPRHGACCVRLRCLGCQSEQKTNEGWCQLVRDARSEVRAPSFLSARRTSTSSLGFRYAADPGAPNTIRFNSRLSEAREAWCCSRSSARMVIAAERSPTAAGQLPCLTPATHPSWQRMLNAHLGQECLIWFGSISGGYTAASASSQASSGFDRVLARSQAVAVTCSILVPDIAVDALGNCFLRLTERFRGVGPHRTRSMLDARPHVPCNLC